MSKDSLQQLVMQGLGAMKAGGEVAAKATDEISGDVQNPQLKSALEEGNKTSQQWTARIASARQKAGEGGEDENKVLEAHFEVSRQIRQRAPDAQSRDLGIIAAGQMALHYWIAAFGTMANYTRQLGMDDVAQDMKTCADEAKQADDKHTQIAQSLLQQA